MYIVGMHATKMYMNSLKPPIYFNSIKDTMLLYIIEPLKKQRFKSIYIFNRKMFLLSTFSGPYQQNVKEKNMILSFKNQQLKDINKTTALYSHIYLTIIKSLDLPTPSVLPHRRFTTGL